MRQYCELIAQSIVNKKIYQIRTGKVLKLKVKENILKSKHSLVKYLLKPLFICKYYLRHNAIL